MIEINLLPGASRKAKGRGPGFSLSSLMGTQSTGRDPWMLGVVVSMIIAVAAVGFMFWTNAALASELATHEEEAVADSTRYAAVFRQRAQAEARRDSVQRQLDVIKAIDADRFVWPHIMDEVSRALPPYTWVTSLNATTPQPLPSGAAPDTTQSLTRELARFRITGNTVDIQALTRFMKLLEASPFIQSVALARSELAMVDGKEVTLFLLDGQYERPDSSVITTAPISLTVR
jgi:Tfp pilus assembly protein PilN